MCNIPKISNSEWEIMKIIWECNSCTSNEVVEKLTKVTNWKPKTIKTLINRLVKKEVLSYKIDVKDKKTYHYFSKVDREKCIRYEGKSFIKKVFNGSMKFMIANFLEETNLSKDEIEELKNILDKKNNSR